VLFVCLCFHALHVLLAVVLVGRTLAKRDCVPDRARAIAAYWSLSAVQWLVLFAVMQLGPSGSTSALSWGAGCLLVMVASLTTLHWTRHGAAQLVVSGAALLATLASATLVALDPSVQALVDPMLRERPYDTTDPLGPTLAEARLRAETGDVAGVESMLLAWVNPAPAPSKKPLATASIAPDILSLAKDTYDVRCTSCHGASGKGDGPGAFAIKPPPRDYTDAEWQKSVTDEELARAITHGGAAVGKSFMMPPAVDLRTKPEVVAALVAMVRDFAAQ
jgi:hypothetical protein